MKKIGDVVTIVVGANKILGEYGSDCIPAYEGKQGKVILVDDSYPEYKVRFEDGNYYFFGGNCFKLESVAEIDAELKKLDARRAALVEQRIQARKVKLEDIVAGAKFASDAHPDELTTLIRTHRGEFLMAGLGGNEFCLFSNGPMTAERMVTYLNDNAGHYRVK